MRDLLEKGYRAKKRPSGHDISKNFSVDNGAAIPPNLIAIPNTESNSFYLRYCEEHGFKPHPARYPTELPEYFIRMLTDPGDVVVDPFGGSCVTGEVCERLNRLWTCVELSEEYCEAALGRFVRDPKLTAKPIADPLNDSNYYRVPRPGILWNGHTGDVLAKDGGRKRQLASKVKRDDVALAKGNGHKPNGHTPASVSAANSVPRLEESQEFRLVAPTSKRQSSRAAMH
jgi:site-specific DNA-methyltransferase (cytosine-N4-specific)